MNKSLCTEPTMTLSSSLQSYRSAVALNNMGVTLLERHCYHQAGATFKSAVSLLRSCCSTRTTSTEQDQALHEARQRMARPQPDLRKGSHSAFDLELLSNAINSKDIHSIMEHHKTSASSKPTKFFAIRIEDLECEKELLSAILLHNFGVSYVFLSKTFQSKRDGANQRKYLNGAARLCRISHSLVCKSSNTNNANSSLPPLHSMEHVLLLVVVSTLVQTLVEAKCETEATPFVALLRQLQWTLTQSTQGQVWLSCCFSHELAAAA